MRSQFLSPVLASIRAFKVGLLDLADSPLQSCKFRSAPKSPWQPAATWDTFSMFVMIFSSPRCSERDFNTINVTLWIAKHEVISGRKSGASVTISTQINISRAWCGKSGARVTGGGPHVCELPQGSLLGHKSASSSSIFTFFSAINPVITVPPCNTSTSVREALGRFPDLLWEEIHHSCYKAVWKPKGFTRENCFQQISLYQSLK